MSDVVILSYWCLHPYKMCSQQNAIDEDSQTKRNEINSKWFNRNSFNLQNKDHCIADGSETFSSRFCDTKKINKYNLNSALFDSTMSFFWIDLAMRIST